MVQLIQTSPRSPANRANVEVENLKCSDCGREWYWPHIRGRWPWPPSIEMIKKHLPQYCPRCRKPFEDLVTED